MYAGRKGSQTGGGGGGGGVGNLIKFDDRYGRITGVSLGWTFPYHWVQFGVIFALRMDENI